MEAFFFPSVAHTAERPDGLRSLLASTPPPWRWDRSMFELGFRGDRLKRWEPRSNLGIGSGYKLRALVGSDSWVINRSNLLLAANQGLSSHQSAPLHRSNPLTRGSSSNEHPRISDCPVGGLQWPQQRQGPRPSRIFIQPGDETILEGGPVRGNRCSRWTQPLDEDQRSVQGRGPSCYGRAAVCRRVAARFAWKSTRRDQAGDPGCSVLQRMENPACGQVMGEFVRRMIGKPEQGQHLLDKQRVEKGRLAFPRPNQLPPPCRRERLQRAPCW